MSRMIPWPEPYDPDALRKQALDHLTELEHECGLFPAESGQEHARLQHATESLRGAIRSFTFAKPPVSGWGQFTVVTEDGFPTVGGRPHPRGTGGLADERARAEGA